MEAVTYQCSVIPLPKNGKEFTNIGMGVGYVAGTVLKRAQQYRM